MMAATDSAAGARRSRMAGICSLSIAGPLIVVGLVQITVWSDHLENASMTQSSLPLAHLEQEAALARSGAAATLLHVVLGVALLVVGLGQLRRRSWARPAALATGAVAVVLGGGLGVALHRLGESPPTSWLFLFAPAVLVGAAALVLGRGRP